MGLTWSAGVARTSLLLLVLVLKQNIVRWLILWLSYFGFISFLQSYVWSTYYVLWQSGGQQHRIQFDFSSAGQTHWGWLSLPSTGIFFKAGLSLLICNLKINWHILTKHVPRHQLTLVIGKLALLDIFEQAWGGVSWDLIQDYWPDWPELSYFGRSIVWLYDLL